MPFLASSVAPSPKIRLTVPLTSMRVSMVVFEAQMYQALFHVLVSDVSTAALSQVRVSPVSASMYETSVCVSPFAANAAAGSNVSTIARDNRLTSTRFLIRRNEDRQSGNKYAAQCFDRGEERKITAQTVAFSLTGK